MARGTSVHLTLDCPSPPALKATPYTRTLRHACVIVGGVVALATQLGCSEPSLRTWLEGHERPPEAIFLGALEVVLLYLSEPGRKN